MALSPNVTATILSVTPTEFEPGKDIRILVAYKANNPGALSWCTMIAVYRADTGEYIGKRHGLVGAKDDYIDHAILCGKMPNSPVQLAVEIWAHDEYNPPVPDFITREM